MSFLLYSRSPNITVESKGNRNTRKKPNICRPLYGYGAAGLWWLPSGCDEFDEFLDRSPAEMRASIAADRSAQFILAGGACHEVGRGAEARLVAAAFNNTRRSSKSRAWRLTAG